MLGASGLQILYGMTLTDPDLLLAMRHRAILLGVIGVPLLVAAIRVSWPPLATVLGLVRSGAR